MDIRALIDQVEKLADIASNVLPGAGLIGDAAEIGGKILDVVDAVSRDARPDQQASMQATRAKLADAVRAKAAATSKRLRG